MTVTAAPARPPEAAAGKSQERRALGVACGAHVLHDGYTDLVWIALPIWQAEFALSYAAVGLLRMIYTGTMASLQIPASLVARRIGGGIVLALGTALSGLCYCIAGLSSGFPGWSWRCFWAGSARQRSIRSARRWSPALFRARALKAFATYNFAGDVGKVLLPASATAMLLIMPWRPAYGLLGLIGIVAAAAIFMLTPRLRPEPPAAALPAQTASAKRAERAHAFRLSRSGRLRHRRQPDARRIFRVLPFLLIGKGAAVTTAGFALTLVFVGGAAGKLACGWVATWIGKVSTIVVAKALTAAGMFAVLLLPLEFAFVLLPLSASCSTASRP